MLKASLFHGYKLPRAASRFAADQQGQDVTEYSLLLVCIFLAVLLVWAVISGSIYEFQNKVMAFLEAFRAGL